MEKYFGNAYRGDPGVPHADPERFVNIWIGSTAFSALTWVNPYMWQLSNQFNWHDKAMLFEQYHWKKAMKKGEPYKFKWTRTTGSPTISTGLFTSLSCFTCMSKWACSCFELLS